MKPRFMNYRLFPILLAVTLMAAIHPGYATTDIEEVPSDRLATLSIDPGLQQIVEDELEKASANLKPKKIIAILADPKTGRILAMASRPASPEQNGIPATATDAISFCYRPSGTFKVVACAGYLNSGAAKDSIFCENGEWKLRNGSLKDAKPYGNQTPLEILRTSSNIGSAKMAVEMGGDAFLKTVRGFGFGQKTNIVPLGESEGMVPSLEGAEELSIGGTAIGRDILVTPLQILMAHAAIANGGILLQPTLHFDPTSNTSTGTRILPETIAHSISNAIVVEAPDLARAEGLSIAGKSGTSKPLGADAGKDQWVTSFVGYFPVEDPRVVGIVVVDQASVGEDVNYGGLIAAPIFSTIAKKASVYLDLNTF